MLLLASASAFGFWIFDGGRVLASRYGERGSGWDMALLDFNFLVCDGCICNGMMAGWMG